MRKLFLLLFIFISCNEQSEKPVENIFEKTTNNQIFIPANVNWDTLSYDSVSKTGFIHKKFPVFYFKNNSTLYELVGVNEILKDSISCCIENVIGYKGKYTFLNDSTLKINMKRVALHAHEKFIDTLKVDAKHSIFYYRNKKFIVGKKISKKSYLEIKKIISHKPSSSDGEIRLNE